MTASDLPAWFVWVFSFAFGSAWGSFGNVVVYRWPNEMSVSLPPSHCPLCKTPIRPYDNVPVLAWLWLRGRCRACHAKISPRYPLIELLFGLLAMAVAHRVFRGDGGALPASAAMGHFLARFSVVFVLGVSALIDLEVTLVPSFVKWFAIGPLAAAALLPQLAPSVDLWTALAGAGLGYFGLRVLFIDGFKLVMGRAGMGLGDAELLIVIGALLGPSGVLFTLGAGAIQGVLAAGVAAALGRRIGADDVDAMDDIDEDAPDEDAPDEDAPADGSSPTPPAAPPEPAADDPEDAPDDRSSVPPRDAPGSTAPPSAAPGPMKMPFVPFLALGAIEYLLGADQLIARWLLP
jgi:leader peptidase (prepilin peptidase)/N-methyltransferase